MVHATKWETLGPFFASTALFLVLLYVYRSEGKNTNEKINKQTCADTTHAPLQPSSTQSQFSYISFRDLPKSTCAILESQKVQLSQPKRVQFRCTSSKEFFSLRRAVAFDSAANGDSPVERPLHIDRPSSSRVLRNCSLIVIESFEKFEG